MSVFHCICPHRCVALLIASFCFVASSCSSDYRADYQIPSPSEQYIALLGCHTLQWNHQLRILRDGQIILDKEVWYDGIESGIVDARWSPDSSEFAVKVCGDGVKFVTVFEISTGRSATFEGKDCSLVPTWTGFDVGCIFGDQLDKYRVDARQLERAHNDFLKQTRRLVTPPALGASLS